MGSAPSSARKKSFQTQVNRPSELEITSLMTRDVSALNAASQLANLDTPLLPNLSNCELFSTCLETGIESNLCDGTVQYLHQKDFDKGTVRITSPGKYQLAEDIEFEPLDNPTEDSGSFALGWFSALTIECANVILDLGGYTLRQGKLHCLKQRFFALIELASSPFIPKQGPGPFKNSESQVDSATSFIVRNGILGRSIQNESLVCVTTSPLPNEIVDHTILGLSAHHGIHGNGNSDFLIEDVIIENFEVGGIHLNEAIRGIIRRVQIRKSRDKVPTTGFFSHAVNLLPILERTVTAHPDATWHGKSGEKILQDLRDVVDSTIDAVKSGRSPTGPFANDSGLPDGGIYGIVLNRRGVAVNGFPKDLGEHPATNLVLAGITVEELKSAPVEVLALSDGSVSDKSGTESYGGKGIVTGPVGDVIPIALIQNDEGKYSPSMFSEAQFFLAKHGVGKAERGATNIPPAIQAWAENDEEIPSSSYYRISFADSMFHVMKGNFGVFLSGVSGLEMTSVTVKKISNLGKPGGQEHPHPLQNFTAYNGNSCRGIALSACAFVSVDNLNIESILSETGSAIGIDLVGSINGCGLAHTACSQIAGGHQSIPILSLKPFGSEQMDFTTDVNAPCIRQSQR